MKIIYRARAPLRLGLAGGGSDLESYSSIHGGAILNATINKFAYVSLIPRDDNKVIFNLLDKNKKTVYNNDDEMLDDIDNQLLIGAYKEIIESFTNKPISFELYTFVDAPPGSGLGSSSTLLVAILAVFKEWLKLPLGAYDIAYLAYKIERINLKMAGGKQDQYAASFGGLISWNFLQMIK